MTPLPYHIDFRLLQRFGLSLNTKKTYFMVYDPCCCPWTLMGVYDNIEDAVVHLDITVEEFLKDCDQGVDFSKGFYYNLSVWDVLERLCENIKDDADRDFDSKDYTLSRIHGNLHAYPEYMKSVCDFVKI